jgi:hypothetical protein
MELGVGKCFETEWMVRVGAVARDGSGIANVLKNQMLGELRNENREKEEAGTREAGE